MLTLTLLLFVSAPDWVEDQDGARLVGHITRCDDQVEILTPAGEFRFDAADLRQIKRRAELRRIYRQAKAGHGDGAHAHQALAEWCLEQGLYDELFDNLDAVLAAQPDGEPATRLLEQARREAILASQSAVSDPTPDALTRLVSHAVGKSPSRAAVATTWLGKYPEAEVVAALDRKRLHLDRAVRERCVEALACFRTEPAIESLIHASLLDRDTGVREQALQAAMDSQHPHLFAPYVKAMASSQRPVREAAYHALGTLADPRAAPALISKLAASSSASSGSSPRVHIFSGEQITYLQDFEVEIAQGSVIADPVIGVLQQGNLLDVRVFGVSGTTYVEKKVIVKALRRITGRDHGLDAAAWKSWWNREGRASMGAKDAASE